MCIHIPIYGIIKKHYFYYAVQKGRRILSGNKLNYIQDEGDWMKKVRVYHYDAFSVISNKGNPAGVVLHADGLCAEDMQQIARQVGFNETSFVLKSDVASFRFRYFTPGHEMDLSVMQRLLQSSASNVKGCFLKWKNYPLRRKREY